MRTDERLKLSRHLGILASDVLAIRTACDSIGQQGGAEATAYMQAITHLATGITKLNDLASERVEINTAPAGGNDGHVDISEL